MKTTLITLAALAFSGSLFAAQMPDTAPIIDQTGTLVHLDIAHVYSSTDLSVVCGVQPAKLVYQDHMGRTHQLDYEALGRCPGDN
ncbi:DUF2790 domain-containing protein [Pseudomonas sp. NA-150]|uniref:DUF2790 domain-containing protein n=1 Tax=Pseudomonas sp. NA-150 TaxID=3367525 RepID=UPI0037C67EE3